MKKFHTDLARLSELNSDDQAKGFSLGRRSVMTTLGASALAITLPAELSAQNTTSFWFEIKKLQLKNTRIPASVSSSGGVRDLSNAFLIAPYGAISWYFSSLALTFCAPYLSVGEIKKVYLPYMDCYIRNLQPAGNILDFSFSGYASPTSPTAWEYPGRDRDSDDSYAATFLSVTWQCLKALYDSNGQNRSLARDWWSENKSTVYMIARRNLIEQIKSNNLTSVFRRDLPVPSVAGDRATASIGYLMDNTEVYLGLKNLADTIKMLSPRDNSGIYLQAANRIVGGIEKLYINQDRIYLPSDAHVRPRNAYFNFYPWVTAQIFPGVMGLPGARQKEGYAWEFVVRNAPNWSHWPGSNNTFSHDPYPWAMLSFSARKNANTVWRYNGHLARKMLSGASRHLSNIRSELSTTNRPYVTINELGWAYAAYQYGTKAGP